MKSIIFTSKADKSIGLSFSTYYRSPEGKGIVMPGAQLSDNSRRTHYSGLPCVIVDSASPAVTLESTAPPASSHDSTTVQTGY